MPYYTYVLRSLKNGDFYVGSTADVYKRLVRHNSGKVRSTKGYAPWKLLQHEQFISRSEAVQHERFLKSHQQKEILEQRYGAVAKR